MNIFIEVRYQFNDRNLWIYLAAWAQIVINSKQHMNLQGIFSSQFSQINRNTSLDSDGSPNTSIINQLNLLEGDYTEESRVVKIESFIYAEMEKQIPSTPYQQLKRSNHYRNQLSRNLSPVSANKYQQIGKDNRIKSIREELIQQNQILQKKLSQNHNYITSFPSKKIIERERYVSPSILQKQYQTFPQKKSLESQQKIKGDDQIFQKLQQQYNNSKIIKLYNFIIKQLPNCSKCHTPCAHLTKLDNKVAFSCKQCQKQKNIHLPIMGVLYDLQNKGRFQQEITIFQTLFEKVDGQISKLQKQIESLQVLKQKLTNLKNTSRKKYKEINQSKYYLKKHINNLQKHHLLQFQKLLPKQYIEQVELWQDIKSQSKRFIQENYNILSKITPIFLHQKINSKLLSNLQKILNYQKQQSVKISISEHIKFPIKKIDSAVFVVDGSYNLPVFQNIRHLHLQFQNKKTLRQLSLLFSNFPRQIFSLSFKYNHKVHSHISAEGFPFMQFIATFPSIKKLDVVIENSKEFFDIVEMCKGMTPKIEIRLKITKHIFSKNGLLLPLNYYSNLFQCFGDQVAKIELNFPQSVDSPAVINYKNLIYKKNLCIFRLDRGEKEEKNMKKLRMLNELQGQNYNHERYVFKKILASKIRLINMIKSTKYQFQKNPTLLSSILNFLI